MSLRQRDECELRKVREIQISMKNETLLLHHHTGENFPTKTTTGCTLMNLSMQLASHSFFTLILKHFKTIESMLVHSLISLEERRTFKLYLKCYARKFHRFETKIQFAEAFKFQSDWIYCIDNRSIAERKQKVLHFAFPNSFAKSFQRFKINPLFYCQVVAAAAKSLICKKVRSLDFIYSVKLHQFTNQILHSLPE